MDDHHDEELLAQNQVRRGRSPLFFPLVLLSTFAIALVGYRTVVPQLSQETAAPVQDEGEDQAEPSPRQCSSAVARAEQLDEARSTPVWLPMLMARSQVVVSGKITDGLLYEDYGVAVVEVEPIDGVGQQNLDRLLLPLSSTPPGAPWQGADFVAFLSGVSEFEVGTVVPGGFFFACGFEEPATGLATFDAEYSQQTDSLNSLRNAYLAFQRFGERQPTKVIAPRVHVLDLMTVDQSRVGVYLPEALAAPFDVYTVDTPGDGQWHIVFANTTVVGRIGIGPCGDLRPEHCSGNLRMEIESLSGVDVPAALQFLGGPTVDGMQLGFGLPVGADRDAPQVVGEVLIYLNSGVIFAVDNITLESRWQHVGGPFSFVRVSEDPGLIVVRRELDGSLTGLSSEGTTVWRYEGGGTVVSEVHSSAPVLVQTWVYSGTANRERVLVALDPVDGALLWEFSRSVPILGAASVSSRPAQSLYVLEVTLESPLSTRKEFVGLEMTTGEVRWRVNPQPGGGVFEIDGYLWWAGTGSIARIDGDSGEVLWKVDRGGINNLSVEGAVVDLADAGAFDLETGRRLRDAAVSPCC